MKAKKDSREKFQSQNFKEAEGVELISNPQKTNFLGIQTISYFPWHETIHKQNQIEIEQML